MAKKKKAVNMSKPPKSAAKVTTKATAAATKGGVPVKKSKTNTRAEVRNQNPQQQGHPK